MPPIVGLCGRSNVGKTTLIERILPRLTAHGLRVGVLKHDVHGFSMDHEGTDTFRFRAAGAAVAAIIGPNGLGVTAAPSGAAGEPDARAVSARLFGDCDLVLAEGFKRAGWPRLEVLRAEISTEPMTDDAAAWVTDFDFDAPEGAVVLKSDDLEAIAAQIGVFARREPTGATWRTSVVVDGRDVGMKPFLHDLIGGLVAGLLEGLSNVADDPRDVTIRTRRHDG